MKVGCLYCGREITVKGLGRKRLDISLNNILESLQTYCSVPKTAKILNCSDGYVYGILKANGLKSKDVIRGNVIATKDNRLL